MSPADPLCLCGVRGCDRAAEHAAQLNLTSRWRKRRR